MEDRPVETIDGSPQPVVENLRGGEIRRKGACIGQNQGQPTKPKHNILMSKKTSYKDSQNMTYPIPLFAIRYVLVPELFDGNENPHSVSDFLDPHFL